jgi:hypothetical protein
VYKPGAHTFAEHPLAGSASPNFRFQDFAASPFAIFRTACNCGALQRSFDQAISRSCELADWYFFHSHGWLPDAGDIPALAADAVHTNTPVGRTETEWC